MTRLRDLLTFGDTFEALRMGYDEALKITDKWGYIRQVWMERLPEIAAVPHTRWVDPYWVNWDFSPAETDAWNSIRSYGGAVLYPQVPVFNWFVDFGHPVCRVGIEVDGAKYHDQEKDAARDAILQRQGWRIFRVPAREFCGPEAYALYHAYHNEVESLQADGIGYEDLIAEVRPKAEAFMLQTGEGVIAALAQQYYGHKVSAPLAPFVMATLDAHRYADFDL